MFSLTQNTSQPAHMINSYSVGLLLVLIEPTLPFWHQPTVEIITTYMQIAE